MRPNEIANDPAREREWFEFEFKLGERESIRRGVSVMKSS